MKRSKRYEITSRKDEPRPGTPLPNDRVVLVRKGLKALEALDFLKQGTYLTKVRHSDKTYRRFFQLESDLVTLHYRSMKLKCMHPSTQISMIQIHEIREGISTDVFTKAAKKLSLNDRCCFSLVYGEKHVTLDLIADSAVEREIWVRGLKHIKKKLGEADLATQQIVWLNELFKKADKDNNKELTLKEILNVLKHLNISVDYDTAKQVFEKADMDKKRDKKGQYSLNMEEFVFFYELLTSRPEIEALFHKYNYEGQYLDPHELHEFLTKEQHTEVSVRQCEDLIQLHESCPVIKKEQMLSMNGFLSLFNSPICDVFNIQHREVYQDMTQPLSHYFIFSSHNTYLTADQLVGSSAVEAYIKALKMGCRCVELDCWDGDKGEPVIYHGRTLTSKILFKEVIGAVNIYAFEASEYPVILSIENHCSVEQQKVMAQHMKKIFGDKLLLTPYPDDLEALPSPESLKGRIILKCKKLPSNDSLGEVSDEDEAAEIVTEETQKRITKSEKKKVKLAIELSDCIVICQSVSFKSFEHSRKNYNCKQMSSLGESKAMDLMESQAPAFIKHNTWQLVRTYPSGRRTDSSNYDPMPLWLVGCQIVALNLQTNDDPMQINRGRFEDNGRCGYVLKPEFLRKPDQFQPKGRFDPSWQRKLTLMVIRGYQLPKKRGDKACSILDPYVKIDIVGVPADNQSFRTKYIKNNGFDPKWNEQFEIKVKVPQLAMIRFQVMDYQDYTSDVTVAQYAMPFTSLERGFRLVHLKSKYGETIRGASLFVHLAIE